MYWQGKKLEPQEADEPSFPQEELVPELNKPTFN